MNDGMTVAYSTATGEQHLIPNHWIGHPVFGPQFTATPPDPETAPTSNTTAGGRSAADAPKKPGARIAADTPTPTSDDTGSSDQPPA